MKPWFLKAITSKNLHRKQVSKYFCPQALNYMCTTYFSDSLFPPYFCSCLPRSSLHDARMLGTLHSTYAEDRTPGATPHAPRTRKDRKKKKCWSKESNSSVLGPFLSKLAPGMVDKSGKARNKKRKRERNRRQQTHLKKYSKDNHGQGEK